MQFKLTGWRLGVVVGAATLSASSAQAQVTGSGTTGRIPKFTAPTVIGDSVITESAGKIGIGTTTPAYTLTVLGSLGIVIDGENSSTAANAYGVQGKITSTASGAGSAGVRGVNSGTGVDGYGVYGSHAGSGRGVYGSSVTGFGIYGIHSSAGGVIPGIQGDTNSTAASAAGVLGRITSTSPGSFSAGLRGINNGTGINGFGVYGSHAGSGYGVYGTAPTGSGVFGSAPNGIGVQGSSSSGSGVKGISVSNDGVTGESTNGVGISGVGFYGVYGAANVSGGKAGYFNGDVQINGTLSKTAGSFQIDYPLDPANKTLSHSFVESPDMMNIYNGNAKLNQKGEALVTMPNYFSALNNEFRYQLTAIGAPGPNLYVASKIKNNQFKIAGGKPGMEVSWMVTGVRQDAYAKAHRIPTVQDKGTQRGYYIFPAGFGQPNKKAMSFAPQPAVKTIAAQKPAHRVATAK